MQHVGSVFHGLECSMKRKCATGGNIMLCAVGGYFWVNAEQLNKKSRTPNRRTLKKFVKIRLEIRFSV
jgi:hypothetical protein